LNFRGPDSSRPWRVAAPLLVVVLLLVSLSFAGTAALAAIRAYVGAESLYSKGQKDAVHHLRRYAATRDDADWARFERALAVPLGDRRARRALDRSPADLAAARAGLLAGGNAAADIDAMIGLYLRWRWLPNMADAFAIAVRADAELEGLAELAARLRQPPATADADRAESRGVMQRLDAADARLSALQRDFSAVLSKAARRAERLSVATTSALALLLAGGAVLLSLRPLRRQAQIETALRSSEERLQRALDASGLTLWDFDIQSGEVFLSESWARAVGWSSGETRTTFAQLASLVPASEREGLMVNLIRALKDPASSYRVEHQVRRVDGSTFWNLSEGRVVLRDGKGRAVRMVGTNRDITERKQAEGARATLETQLRESQKMEAIGTLAGGIAHDFNNILGAILGNVALARGEPGDADMVRLSLEQINKAALRARSLVQQILAYSRRQPQELRSRALAPLIEESLSLLRSTLPPGVTLDTQLCDDALFVMADATQIQQVLMNLCTNAWHAMKGRGGRVSVGLQSQWLDGRSRARSTGLPPGRYVHLWVADDGSGMDAATRARIFEPFFTTKPIGEGTGLGLSVVHGIVAAHGGAIEVHSEPGKGSTFDMYFPLLQPPDTPTALSNWAELDAPGGSGQGRHVLYIDDDEVMLRLGQRLRQREGYRVSCCQDPHEAVRLVRSRARDFDLVVSDFNMPQCSGLDVARSLAQIRPDLPVVISSGHITQELHEQARRSGARGLMHKENTLEELGTLVQRVLQEA